METVKEKRTISSGRIVYMDFLLLSLSFFICYFIKMGTLVLAGSYLNLLLMFYLCWFAASMVAKKFKPVVEKAIADGASVIVPIPACIGQLLYKTGVTKLNGATVLDPVVVVVKVAEMLVDLKKLGIEASRKLQVYGSPGRELLTKVYETYAPIFKIEY